MNHNIAVNLLNTLGNNIRLLIFRMLIQAGDKGLNPKDISDELNIMPNKLSFHLNDLKKFGLITNKKDGRELIYSANYKLTQELVEFLFENCCQGENNTNSCNSSNKCII